MYKFDTKVQHLKYKVLRTVAKHAWDSDFYETFLDIPKEIIPGKTPTMRCCVYKERAILAERVKLAAGGDRNNPNVIETLDIACDDCPTGGYTVTEACRGCIAHRCEDACPRGAITHDEFHHAHIDKSKCINCGKCAAVCPYSAIYNRKRPCQNACKIGAISMNEDGTVKIDNSKCISCGACVYQCPFGALSDKSFILDAIKMLKNCDRVYAVVAPAIVSQFTYAKPGQVITAIKALGFCDVLEAALGADMVAYNEAAELAERGFLTSSCCPAFVATVKRHAPELADCISDAVSPMVARSKLEKHNHPGALTCFIGPCIAKKVEAREHPEDIDFVLTFEELKCMMDSQGIDPAKCEVDAFHAASSADGCGFPQAAGVTQAVKDYVKETHPEVDVDSLKTVYCNGLEECLATLKDIEGGKLDVQYMEGMACQKGCLNGPGALTEPGLTRVLLKRFAGTTQATSSADIKMAMDGVKNVDMERVYLRK